MRRLELQNISAPQRPDHTWSDIPITLMDLELFAWKFENVGWPGLSVKISRTANINGVGGSFANPDDLDAQGRNQSSRQSSLALPLLHDLLLILDSKLP